VWVVEWLPDGSVRSAINLHKSIGITVLGLVLLRILWRWSHPAPPLPLSYPWYERVGAHTAHMVLYGLMLGLPLSGWIHDSAFKDAAKFPLRLFDLVPFPRIGPIMDLPPDIKEQVHTLWFQVHGALAYGLYALLALHILGALKHQWIDHKNELARILPWGEPTTPTNP